MNECDVAKAAAIVARNILIEWNAPLGVAHKGAVDLVTEVDLACEEGIREVLFEHTPDISVVGEEQGGALGKGPQWVIDPIDGTTNFVHGFPHYAVSIALQTGGVTKVGVVLDVVRNLMYTAEQGKGAFCNGDPIYISDCKHLDKALLATGFPYDRRERPGHYLRYFEAMMTRCQGIRRSGSAALDLAMVASGVLDGFWEFGLSIWDVAAGVLLVEEAGGVVTSVDGSALKWESPAPLAANPYLHTVMMDVLSKVDGDRTS
jgi:myo-inositol-1(or 4)-monophosphatase